MTTTRISSCLLAFALAFVSLGTPTASAHTTTGSYATTKGQAVADTAYRYRNAQYRWGATGPTYFDCSGYTQAMFRYNGISIPRDTRGQAYGGYGVSRSSLRVGDIVVFQNTYRPGVSHVGIYFGDGSFIHMSSPSTDVNIDSIWSSFYRSHWWGARRYT